MCIVFALTVTGLINLSQTQLSDKIVSHLDAGNFINTEDLSIDKPTMLHWFSKEVQIYSEADELIHFLIFNPTENFELYKNKNLIFQSKSPFYPLYQADDFIIFSIDLQDYKDHRVNLYTSTNIAPNLSPLDQPLYFAGSAKGLYSMAITKKSVDNILKSLLFLTTLLYAYLYKARFYGPFLLLSTIFIYINIELGLAFFISLIFLTSFRTTNKKRQLIYILLLCLLCIVLPFARFYFVIGLFLLITILNYDKNKSNLTLLNTALLFMVFSLSVIDWEFSFFRLYALSIYMFFMLLYLLFACFGKLHLVSSKDQVLKVEWLRGISHDLKLPLSTIKLNTDLLSQDNFDSLLNKKSILHIIKMALDDLTYLTNSLTIYTSKDLIVDPKYKANFQDAIYHTLHYFKFNTKKIEIKTDLYQSDIDLPLEEIWLNRLVYNLVDNAYKYTDPYGEIVITLSKEKKKIVLSVRDDGMGMAADEIEKILQPFYRIDQSRHIPGMGLGLSIVKTIVDHLDGKIEVYSKPGIYTEFIIKI